MKKYTDLCHRGAAVLEWLIGVAFAVCLFVGGLGFIGFVVAFCIGGDTATEICTWIYKSFYPVLIKIGTGATLATFIMLYLRGDAAWVKHNKKTM